ncbi:MAG: crossover junction endodeoxyribonuclease RuvC [Rickettsiaceae bacterium]|nr:crossover junction endodeoxyribonuclease RuvC [Rickettsiaceae bacterium]
MRVLGIDPGLNNTGFAVLEQNPKSNIIVQIKSGVIKSAGTLHVSQKLYNIFYNLDEIITEYQPSCVAIEEIFVNSNSKTSLSLGFARGAILTSIGKHSLKTIDLAPNKVKKTIVGYGKAHKDQLQKMLSFVIPGIYFRSGDEADAIAIAYAGLVLH